jgi:hypothetical protein
MTRANKKKEQILENLVDQVLKEEIAENGDFGVLNFVRSYMNASVEPTTELQVTGILNRTNHLHQQFSSSTTSLDVLGSRFKDLIIESGLSTTPSFQELMELTSKIKNSVLPEYQTYSQQSLVTTLKNNKLYTENITITTTASFVLGLFKSSVPVVLKVLSEVGKTISVQQKQYNESVEQLQQLINKINSGESYNEWQPSDDVSFKIYTFMWNEGGFQPTKYFFSEQEFTSDKDQARSVTLGLFHRLVMCWRLFKIICTLLSVGSGYVQSMANNKEFANSFKKILDCFNKT